MLPGFAVNNCPDGRDMNAVLSGKARQGRAGLCARAYFAHLIGGESCAVMALPSRPMVWVQPAWASIATCRAPLGNTVGSVVLDCAEEQVPGIAAETVIAVVTDKKVVWNRPVCQFIREPVSSKVETANRHSAISCRAALPGKRPAGISAAALVDVPPQSGQRLAVANGHTDLATIPTAPPGERRRFDVKLFPALLAPDYHFASLNKVAPRSGRLLLRESVGPRGHNRNVAQHLDLPQQRQSSTKRDAAQVDAGIVALMERDDIDMTCRNWAVITWGGELRD